MKIFSIILFTVFSLNISAVTADQQIRTDANQFGLTDFEYEVFKEVLSRQPKLSGIYEGGFPQYDPITTPSMVRELIILENKIDRKRQIDKNNMQEEVLSRMVEFQEDVIKNLLDNPATRQLIKNKIKEIEGK